MSAAHAAVSKVTGGLCEDAKSRRRVFLPHGEHKWDGCQGWQALVAGKNHGQRGRITKSQLGTTETVLEIKLGQADRSTLWIGMAD